MTQVNSLSIEEKVWFMKFCEEMFRLVDWGQFFIETAFGFLFETSTTLLCIKVRLRRVDSVLRPAGYLCSRKTTFFVPSCVKKSNVTVELKL